MGSMSTIEDPVAATAMVVERGAVAAHLLDEQTQIEPFVMLESRSEGARVRKLTMVEKLDYADRTEGSVFMADEHEQREMFDLLKRRSPSKR